MLGVIKPFWLARIIGISTAFAGINLVILVYGFHPRSKFVLGGKIARSNSERTKKHAEWIIRGLVILLGLVLGVSGTWPLVHDCINLSAKGRSYAIEIKGKVYNEEGRRGIGSSLLQSVTIEEGSHFTKRSYSAYYGPRVIKGDTYLFLIAPKSKAILEARKTN